MPPPKCDFFDVYFFLWTYDSSIYLLPGDKWEESSPDSGNLTHCWKTLQLIKFHLVKNMKGNRGI